jgi:LacI family transcriptional regulator
MSLKPSKTSSVPYVPIDRKISTDLDANFVGVDDEIVGLIGTEHLIQCGHKRIAYIGGKNLSTTEGRFRGYQKALAKHGIPENEQYIRTLSETGDAGEDEAGLIASDLLAMDEPPTALYTSNDPIAMGAMKGALDSGKRVPKILAIAAPAISATAAICACR